MPVICRKCATRYADAEQRCPACGKPHDATDTTMFGRMASPSAQGQGHDGNCPPSAKESRQNMAGTASQGNPMRPDADKHGAEDGGTSPHDQKDLSKVYAWKALACGVVILIGACIVGAAGESVRIPVMVLGAVLCGSIWKA